MTFADRRGIGGSLPASTQVDESLFSGGRLAGESRLASFAAGEDQQPSYYAGRQVSDAEKTLPELLLKRKREKLRSNK